MHIKFWISIGRDTFDTLRPITGFLAEEYNVDIEYDYNPGDKVPDVGIRITGEPERIASFVKGFSKVLDMTFDSGGGV
jgi:hypothetical protein